MIISNAPGVQLLQTYLNRLAKDGLALTAVQIAALLKLSVGLDSIGLANFIAVYPFIGGLATTHAYNLISSLYPITWHGSLTHDANGVFGDGSTGYGDTGFIPNSVLVASDYNNHSSIYINKKSTATSSLDMACCDATQTYYFGSGYFNGGAFEGVAFSQDKIASTIGGTLIYKNGLVVGSRSSNDNNRLYIRGIQTAINYNTASAGLPTRSLLLLAINDAIVTQFSNSQIAFVSFGYRLTAAKVLVLNNVVAEYQRDLSRA